MLPLFCFTLQLVKIMQIFLNRLNNKQHHIRKTKHEKTNTNTKKEEGQTLELDVEKSMRPPHIGIWSKYRKK